MLDRTLPLVALAVAAGLLVPVNTDAAHRRHHPYYGPRYPRYGHGSVHLGYAPGFYPSFGAGYGYYPFSFGFSFLGGPKDPRGAVRFEVFPKHSEVYVDGYYAGIVDDFGKLTLDPGPHEITLYLDGHRVFTETIYSTTGSTVKLHHEMEPLAPGEPMPLRPAVPGGATRSSPPASYSPPPAPPASSSGGVTTTSSEYGELALRSQPADAEVWIDGEQWHVAPGGESLTMHLAAGRYELELKKDGYEPFVAFVEIISGEATAMNVLLRRRAPEVP